MIVDWDAAGSELRRPHEVMRMKTGAASPARSLRFGAPMFDSPAAGVVVVITGGAKGGGSRRLHHRRRVVVLRSSYAKIRARGESHRYVRISVLLSFAVLMTKIVLSKGETTRH